MFPKDVVEYIDKNFNESHSKLVKVFLERKYTETLNVGKDQYVRSILFLLDKNIDNLKKYEVIADPRDIVSLAHHKSKEKFNYFMVPIAL